MFKCFWEVKEMTLKKFVVLQWCGMSELDVLLLG